MDFNTYMELFNSILNNPSPKAPYDNPDYHNYTKLNHSRSKRWLKHGRLTEEMVRTLKAVRSPQHWTIITEPWCGDASHIVPFLHMMTLENTLITVEYQLRDSEPFLINNYLTNGGKSIPKLIVRNEAGEDLIVWGPRPAQCQILYNGLLAEKAPFETIKVELQKWYNDNDGKDLQLEIESLLKAH